MLKWNRADLPGKRALAVWGLALGLSLGCFGTQSLSEDMGVVLIAGPEAEEETVSLDDVKLNTDIEIDNYGILNFESCETRDYVYIGGDNSSGQEAEYLILKMTLINTDTKERSFMQDVSVKVVYDEVYEYAGWARQTRDFISNGGHKADSDTKIGALYKGYFIFGCTLPNYIFTTDRPLRMEIEMDGNEFTYYVRK